MTFTLKWIINRPTYDCIAEIAMFEKCSKFWHHKRVVNLPLKNYDNGTSKKIQTKLVQISNLEGPSAKSKCNGFINIFMDFLTKNF